jgi:hypothetical protein
MRRFRPFLSARFRTPFLTGSQAVSLGYFNPASRPASPGATQKGRERSRPANCGSRLGSGYPPEPSLPRAHTAAVPLPLRRRDPHIHLVPVVVDAGRPASRRADRLRSSRLNCHLPSAWHVITSLSSVSRSANRSTRLLALPRLLDGGPRGALAVLRGHVPTADRGAVRALAIATGALRLCHVITPDPRPNEPGGRSLPITFYYIKLRRVVN